MTTSMHRALHLARRAKGRTSPNPAVGAVLVRRGHIVGEGWTEPAGGAHAEVVALRAAGSRAAGAALYVTLEPCGHWGRTPPCTEAILAAGVAEVHIATLDPNPRMAGQSVAALQAAGVRVYVGEEAGPARDLNADFARYITAQRPWIVAKYAMSLDGKIATRTGDSRFISGPRARAEVHRLRDTVDAIVVGVGTVLRDHPRLTTRLSAADLGREPRHPWRLILDSRARTPLDARLLSPSLPGRTTLCVTDAAPAKQLARLRARGADIMTLPADPNGRVDLTALAGELGRREVMSVLVEGGAAVHAAFLAAGLVDRLVVYIAPMLIGGADAPGPVGGRGIARLGEALRGPRLAVERVGDDLRVTCDLASVVWPEFPASLSSAAERDLAAATV